MARDRASISMAIWADAEFRDLSPRAQHLYFVLLTSPTLSYCGVMDWRPRRIAKFAKSWSEQHVLAAAADLVAARFLVVDEDTEEALIRSFVRHDGLMQNPKMAQAVAKAALAVASATLRNVVIDELRRLRRERPELSSWSSPWSAPMFARLLRESNDTESDRVSNRVSDQVSDQVSQGVSDTQSDTPSKSIDTATATATATYRGRTSVDGARKKRATPTPEMFEVSERFREWARQRCPSVDLDRELERFLDHHRAKGSLFVDWTAAARNWMTSRYQAPVAAEASARVPEPVNLFPMAARA